MLTVPLPFGPGNVAAPAANTAAVLRYNADGPGRMHVLSGVAWSYDGDPTGGRLKIEDGAGNTVFDESITKGGPGEFFFDPPFQGSPNTDLVITLAAGGGTVVGKVNAIGRYSTTKPPLNGLQQFGPQSGVLDFSRAESSGLIL